MKNIWGGYDNKNKLRTIEKVGLKVCYKHSWTISMDGLWMDFPYSRYQMGESWQNLWFRLRRLYIADGSEPKHLLCTGSRREVMISQTKTTAVNAHTLAHTWVFWDAMIKTHVDLTAWCNTLMISTLSASQVLVSIARWTTCTWGKKTKLNKKLPAHFTNNCKHMQKF